MSKVVLLSTLKANSTALIQDFTGKGKNNGFRYHLMAMGFVPGRNVEILQKTNGGYEIKVDEDTSVAIGKSAAKSIMVKPLQEDIFEATVSNIEKENFFSKFFKLFDKKEEA